MPTASPPSGAASCEGWERPTTRTRPRTVTRTTAITRPVTATKRRRDPGGRTGRLGSGRRRRRTGRPGPVRVLRASQPGDALRFDLAPLRHLEVARGEPARRVSPRPEVERPGTGALLVTDDHVAVGRRQRVRLGPVAERAELAVALVGRPQPHG